MRACTQPLLARVRITVADAGAASLEVRLDGWPLLLVDLEARTVRVNDLRRSAMFTHAARIPAPSAEVGVGTGAMGDELYLLLGDAAAVFVAVARDRAVHADVKVLESASGRLLLDQNVRYRQLETDGLTSPMAIEAGE